MQHLLDKPLVDRAEQGKVKLSQAFQKLAPPVIIIGMHRSGTSMVAGMLHAMGAFVDPMLESVVPGEALPSDTARTAGYGEAVAFRLVNEAIMGRTGANWCQVEPFLARRDHPRFAGVCVRQLGQATHEILLREYLQKSRDSRPAIWGWKDPRNSLTLPYWLQLFPNARLLHVRRNPEDIIRSLVRREAANRSKAAVSPPPTARDRIVRVAGNPGAVVRSIGRRLGISPSASTVPETQDQWMNLVNTYTGECESWVHHPGGYLEVSYEEIVRDPINNAGRIADFIAPNIALNAVLKAASFVSVSRN